MTEGKSSPLIPAVITISTGTIIRAILVLAALGFLYLIRDVLAILLAAVFLAALMDPFADLLERRKVPRGLAALVVYVIGLLVVGGLVALLLQPVTNELQNFFSFFAPFVQELTGDDTVLIFTGEGITSTFEQMMATIRASGVSAAVPELVSLGSTAVGALAAVVIILILAFFLVAEKTAMVKALAFVAPPEYQPFVMQVAGKMRDRLGSWLRGQILLMLAVFTLTYLALTILGVPYALILALMAGLLEVIPFIGPFLSGIPALILALSISPVHALLTVGVYILIQMIEGNFLVPKIMQRVSGLNPIISLLAVLIGWRIGGVAGAFLSLPLAMAISVFLAEVFKTGLNPAIEKSNL